MAAAPDCMNEGEKIEHSHQDVDNHEYPSPGVAQNLSESYTIVGKRKLILIMVGLPARGKTYIARKLRRYLTWLGFETQVFNIGNYRRSMHGAKQPARFFDPDNAAGVKRRTEAAMAALTDMMEWLEGGGKVGIYDGTNSTFSRRNLVDKQIEAKRGDMQCDIVWIESICDIEAFIARSISETKQYSPDYADVAFEEARRDFMQRIQNYQKAYETLSDESKSYIKLINAGQQVIGNRIDGYLSGKVLFFLANLQIHKKPIFFSRHGESEYNRTGRIGGDSPLSPDGRAYAKELGKFLKEQPEYSENMTVLCSTLRRTIETVVYSGMQRPTQWRALSEIEAGVCDGMTYSEIRGSMPEEFAARSLDKLNYRYPRGESYVDVINRLEPVIFELERAKCPMLVIGHRAVLRCLYSYFKDVPMADVPNLPIPLHTVFKLTPKAYQCVEEKFSFGIESMDSTDSTVRKSLLADSNTPEMSDHRGHSVSPLNRHTDTRAHSTCSLD
eukprot:249513_1